MNRDGDKGKMFMKRAAILAGVQFFLLLILVSRMYYLQVIQADKYIMMAESNRISMRILPPPRGIILDRFGEPLAVNNQNFRVQIISEQTSGSLVDALDSLGKIIPLSPSDYEYVQKEVKRKRAFVPVTVAENLTWEKMASIQLNAPELPGINIDEGLTRYYPYGYETAHVVGYVGPVNEKEITGDPLLELPGFRKGKTGVEAQYDLPLRGSGGFRKIEVNVLGREIRELEKNKGIPGAQIDLTLDIRLQKYALEQFKKNSGALILMDVDNGDILALVSAPSFDANIFNTGISNDEWQKLASDIRKPLVNKAISGEYSPGSTFKMIVALAALESGVISSSTEIYCGGHMELGSHRFHCWKPEGHGYLNLIEALAVSCDIYFYEVARKVGIDKIADMAKRFGLGVKQEIDIPGEKSGLVPTQEWKKRVFDEPWQQGETMLTGIGQSYITTTPLQMAMVIAKIANGGKNIKPHLIKKAYVDEPKNIKISKHFLNIVKQGMNDVMNDPQGTAFYSRIPNQLGGMSGKTGTTQVRRISMKERESRLLTQEELAWEERNHALFVGYAPINNPKYAIAVIVEHGGGGASVAAPIAKNVMEKALILYQEEVKNKQNKIKE